MADTATGITDPSAPLQLGTESSLSNWAGDYVTDMLGKGWGLSEQGYQAYDGPLTAGSSPLQDQAFSGIAGLTIPEDDWAGNTSEYAGDMAGMSYDGSNMDFNRWDNNWADQYMNPYLQQALNPMMDEQRRQAEITRQNDATRLTKAGAFGGGRQAVMDSELNDNTARLMSEILGTGYRNAYDTAFGNFTSDEGRRLDTMQANEDSRQFGAGFGLDALKGAADAESQAADTYGRQTNATLDLLREQFNMGDEQRNIWQQGMDADRAQFEEERENPYKQVQFMQSLLQNMPLEAQSNEYSAPSMFSQIGSSIGAGGNLADQIKDALGL